MSAPTILALDLSLTATGWATSLDEHGVMTEFSTLRGADRLHAWDEWLTYIMLKDRPDLAVVEGYAFNRANQMAAIAEWGGLVRWRLFTLQVPLVIIPPATLKKYATGKGNATKPDMRMELYKRSGLDVTDDNEVDALWLLAAATEATGEPLWPMPKDRLAVLGKVDWPVRA